MQKIEVASGQATPFDTSPVIKQLQQVLAGGAISLPEELLAAQHGSGMAGKGSDAQNEVPEEETPPVEVVNPTIIPVGSEGDDVEVFRVTVRQQIEIIRAALATLQKDGSHKESIDAVYRCLIAVRNACSFVGQTEIKVYAERTAGIVDQGRTSGIDFGLMVDLLSQEVSIIDDMVQKALDEGKINTDADSSAQVSESDSAPEAPAKNPEVQSTSAVTVPLPESVKQQPAPSPGGKSNRIHAQTSRPSPPAPSAPAQAAQMAPAPASAAAKPKPTASAAKAASAAAPAGEAHKSSSTIRVDHERLDHLMNLIGELIINRNRYTLIARSLEGGGENVNISEVAQSLSETTYAMARISDDLQDTIMKVRMVPVSSVFSRFPRLVRDLSRKSGKEVDLIMEGEETELDKSVVEVIGDPLVHLIRNSVDHGIESEDVRLAAGKAPKGKVTLRAFHKGNSVAIEIEDDGKGIDPDKMREVAIRKGVITPEEAAQLDDREAMELIFAPGFSSAEKITDISGRGVGMDVVRTNIKNLKGSVNTYSEVGKGTRFTLSLPLTLAIIDALMVNVSGQMYAIPLDAVSETTKIEFERLTDVKGRKAVTLRGLMSCPWWSLWNLARSWKCSKLSCRVPPLSWGDGP